MPTFPIASPVYPKTLTGLTNGRITLLADVGYRGQLHPIAAHAWRTLTIIGLLAGKPLTYTYGGTYRSYESQLSLFLSRYTRTYNPLINTWVDKRTFEGKTWFKLKGVAAAASPGTSNHGWGLAIDAAMGTHPDNARSVDLAYQNFLLTQAPPLGFAWSLQSEPWHIQYIAGDKMSSTLIPKDKPWIRPEGPAVDSYYVWYLQAVLRCKLGQEWMFQNGIYDGPTQQAVKNMQAQWGIPVDGVVGPQTWYWIDISAAA